MIPRLRNPSLLLTMSLVVIGAVVSVMLLQTSYRYLTTESRLKQQLEHELRLSTESLQTNVSGFLAAYAVNEYEVLVHTEMTRRNAYAIVIEDYKMGQILGTTAYISGKIRDDDLNIVEYGPDNPAHVKRLQDCCYSTGRDIVDESGRRLGHLQVYISNQNIRAQLADIINRSAVEAASIALLLILSLFLSLRHFVLKPVSDIAKTITNSDEHGVPMTQVPDTGPRELSTLSRSINAMIDTIRASRHTLQQQADHLDFHAHNDELTGLHNRHYFEARLEQGIEKARRDDLKMALLFIDLDHFKEVNDSLGHKAGDEVLKTVSQRLKTSVRKEDTLARLGGDEFTVMIEGLKVAEDASLLAEKILLAIVEPVEIQGNQFILGCSIGISLYPDNGTTAQDLLKHADAAMYKAKSEGRNNFQYYSAGMTAQAFERLWLETHLRLALKNDALSVHYQPQIDAASQQVIGVEALARWHHPARGDIPPARFIPIAESSGLIMEIDRHVIRRSMQQVMQWREKGLNIGTLSVNISVRHLQSSDFIDWLVGALSDTGLPPERLELEVTESQVMDKPEACIKALRRVFQLGIRIALDDFGTGHSALAYLKRLPITRLKIDRSFLSGLPHDEEDASLTRAIIAMGESLGLDLIAEGVESKAQENFLLENGCNHIQGFLYARPMPPDELVKLIASNAATASQGSSTIIKFPPPSR